MCISTPSFSPSSFIFSRKSAIPIEDEDTSATIIIIKLPDKTVWLMSAIFILCEKSAELTFAMMPTWSVPETVIITFVVSISVLYLQEELRSMGD